MKPNAIFKPAISIPRKIEVNFTGTPTYFNVTKCITRYDKTFAFGWSLDDSLSDAVKIALPAFQGGNVVEKDGNHLNYPGMFYTDGCGNDIPFNFELKTIGSFLTSGETSISYLNYKDFRKLYVAGAHYINHSWSHKDTDGQFSSDPLIKSDEIIAEITSNYDFIKSLTGIRATSFSVPSNYAPYYPIAYQLYLDGVIKRLAYMRPDLSTTLRQNYNCQDYTMEFYSTLTEIGSGAIRDFSTWQDSTITDTAADLDIITAKILATDNNNHYWFSSASHNLGVNDGAADPVVYAGFKWATFKAFYERLYNTYGKLGNDSIWMDHDTNIWEYIRCYANTAITVNDVSSIKKEISVDFSLLSDDYKSHTLSFVISTDAAVSSLTFTGYDTTSYQINHKSLGSGNVLVNIQYITQYEKALVSRLTALSAVETLEFTGLEADRVIAQAAVDLLLNGAYKTSLQVRIDAVVIVPESRTVKIDLGSTTTTYDTPTPWNNFKAATGVVVSPLTTLGPLLDMSSTATPFSLRVTNGNFTVAAVGSTSTVGIYPASAMRDSFSTPIGTFGELTLLGLNPAKKYDIKVFAYRSISSVQRYTIGLDVRTFNIQNNITTTVDFLNLTGSTEIALRVEGGTGSIVGHVAVLEIIEHN